MNHDAMIPRLYRIERVRKETQDTFTWNLKSCDSENGNFHPGQFNMLTVFGVGEAPISISGNPVRSNQIVHTTRAVGSVTKAMQAMKKGAVLGVRGPFGNPWPLAQSAGSDLILVAGGIGLAPLRPVLYEALEHRKRYGKIALLYGTRTPQDILFRKELEVWRGRLDLDVIVTVDHAGSDWKGNVGFVTSMIRKISVDPGQCVAMICGPEVMIRFAALELMGKGVETENIFVSLERNMKCGIGLCGHCQMGPVFLCKDGPVFSYNRVERWLSRSEV